MDNCLTMYHGAEQKPVNQLDIQTKKNVNHSIRQRDRQLVHEDAAAGEERYAEAFIVTVRIFFFHYMRLNPLIYSYTNSHMYRKSCF